MYQTSEQFNSAILGDYRKFQSKLRIGTSEVTEGFRSIKQTIRSTNGDNISVGGAISSYIEVEMWYPQLILGNAEIEWILSLELPSGGIEEIPMGLFTVQEPKEDDGVVRFTAYDRIYSKMGMPYFSKLNYPADGKDILREISSQTGVPIDVSTLPDGVLVDRIKISSGQSLDENGNAVTNETFSNPFDGYIHREALGNIAMIYGRIAVMDRAGNVVFKWYSNTDYSVGIDRHYGDLVLNESVFSVGTISCQTGSSVLTSGSGAENVYLENNIMTQSKLDAIYQQFQALEYIPATFSFLGDSRLDICDIITVHDIKGNLIKVPLMEIVQEYDGGLLTRVKSFGGVNQESSAVKGPTVQKMDRMYTELFLAKELIGNKATFEDLKSINAEFRVMKADMITVDNLEANVIKAGFITAESIETQYAKIDLANIKAGSITTAMLGTAVVGTTQIADGSITDAKIVDLTANKINAGTLSVERLEIRGSDKSIVYALNNITGALQAQNVNTLNGEILTPRSITADKIVANSITGNEIAAKTINANNINVTDLFAQDITATGKIRGMELIGVTGDFTGTVTADTGKMGFLTLTDNVIYGDNIYIYAGDSLNGANISMSGSIENPGVSSLYMASGMVVNDTDYNTNASLRIQPLSKGVTLTMFNSTGMTLEIEAATGDIRTYGNIYASDEIISTYPNGLRIAYGNYGFFIRNDGDSTYFMLTNSGDKLGTWNGLRPIVIKDSTGAVIMQNGLTVEKAGTNNPLTVQSNIVEASVKYSSTAAGYFWAAGPGAGQNTFDRFGFYNGSGGSIAYIDKNGNMVLVNNLTAAKGVFHGNYNAAPANRYGNSALEIRENGLVGSAQTDIGYAPSIGFHWSGRVAGTLVLDSKGQFQFVNQSGGNAPLYVSNLYATTVTQTSDEREKDIMNLDLLELSDCFMSIKPIAFRWKYGSDKKIHLGVGAQTTERKMIEAGYDPSQFDMIQHDDIEVVSDSGLMERYGINYQELNMLTMMQTQKTTRDLWKLQDWALSTDIELAVINQKQEAQEARIRDLELQLVDALFEIEQLKARIA